MGKTELSLERGVIPPPKTELSLESGDIDYHHSRAIASFFVVFVSTLASGFKLEPSTLGGVRRGERRRVACLGRRITLGYAPNTLGRRWEHAPNTLRTRWEHAGNTLGMGKTELTLESGDNLHQKRSCRSRVVTLNVTTLER